MFCSFEHKLTATDLGKLAKIIGAVIPIPNRHHLISNSHTGLHTVIERHKDYARVRTALRAMVPTVLRDVQGNQMVLGVMSHGSIYTIRNTGPVIWEKGDTLVLMAPLMYHPKVNSCLSMAGWDLILPWIVPLPLATEITQRILVTAMLSLDRSYEEVRAATAQLRTIQFRDITFTIPEINVTDHMLLDLKNACISLSMVANLSTELVMTYVRKLALEDTSMLLIKCQELLGQRNVAARPTNLSPVDELKKLSALFVMLRQLTDIISETPIFTVCDVSADNQTAVCIFKG